MKSQVANSAVDFGIEDTDGMKHTLKDSAGDWLLLVFHRHLG